MTDQEKGELAKAPTVYLYRRSVLNEDGSHGHYSQWFTSFVDPRPFPNEDVAPVVAFHILNRKPDGDRTWTWFGA